MKKHIAEFIVPPIIDAASPIVSIGIARLKQISTSIKVQIKFYSNSSERLLISLKFKLLYEI